MKPKTRFDLDAATVENWLALLRDLWECVEDPTAEHRLKQLTAFLSDMQDVHLVERLTWFHLHLTGDAPIWNHEKRLRSIINREMTVSHSGGEYAIEVEGIHPALVLAVLATYPQLTFDRRTMMEREYVILHDANWGKDKS